MTALGVLAVWSGLSLNLLLQFGLGICGIIPNRDALPDKQTDNAFWKIHGYSSLILCIAVFVLWLFFTYALTPLTLGFLEPFLLFPLSVSTCTALELFFSLVFPKKRNGSTVPAENAPALTPVSAYNGLVLAALLITLRLAASPVEALVLSLGLSLGRLAAALILREIYKRSCLEAVPRLLRGSPLIIISMGLLSLTFSAGAAIFFRVLFF
jgi:electron transport complex protein RnfA